MEIKKLNEKDVVLWSRPRKIKENWFNAIIEKPIFEDRNIQFIMRCCYDKLGYIVVSRKALSLEQIENINLKDYVFEGFAQFSRGVKIEKVGAVNEE